MLPPLDHFCHKVSQQKRIVFYISRSSCLKVRINKSINIIRERFSMKWITLLSLLFISMSVAQQRMPSERMPSDPFDPKPIVNDFPSNEIKEVPPSYSRVVELRWISQQAHKDLVRVVDNLRDDFERSAEMQSALREQQIAYDAFIVAKEKALAIVYRDLRYNELKKMSSGLQGSIEVSRVNKVDFRALADLRLSYNQMSSEMEMRVLSSDIEYINAKNKLADAYLRVKQLRDRFERDIRRSSEFIYARSTYSGVTISYLSADAYYQKSLELANIALVYTYWSHRYDQYRYSLVWGNYPFYNFRYPVVYRRSLW